VTREGQVVLQIHADGNKLNIGIGQPLAQRLLSESRTDIGALSILDPSAFLRRDRWSPPTRVNSGIAAGSPVCAGTSERRVHCLSVVSLTVVAR
jgi:hypothetical protein